MKKKQLYQDVGNFYYSAKRRRIVLPFTWDVAMAGIHDGAVHLIKMVSFF